MPPSARLVLQDTSHNSLFCCIFLRPTPITPTPLAPVRCCGCLLPGTVPCNHLLLGPAMAAFPPVAWARHTVAASHRSWSMITFLYYLLHGTQQKFPSTCCGLQLHPISSPVNAEVAAVEPSLPVEMWGEGPMSLWPHLCHLPQCRASC